MRLSLAITSSASEVSRSSSARIDWAMASSTIAPIRRSRSFRFSMSLSKWRCMSSLGLTEPSGHVIFGHLFARIHEDGFRVAVFDELAQHEKARSVRDARRLLHVVRDDDDRVTLFEL